MDLIQVDSLKHQCETQEAELKKSKKQAQEGMLLAAEESAKCKAAKDVIKSLTGQVVSCESASCFLSQKTP